MHPDYITALDLPTAYHLGKPAATARIRSAPEDFRVDEILGFQPDGEGEHVLLRVRKRLCNTDWVARRLARLAGVRPFDVSYAGMKDRNAVTEQWFSLQLPGRPEPDWSVLAADGIEILESHRHRRKLRQGSHRGNRFQLVLREVQGETTDLDVRLRRIASEGVPNLFGEQRFGRNNLGQAAAMFGGTRVSDRHRRGLYLSAARSLLFNRVLLTRIAADTWNRALPGEALQLAGSRSFFVADDLSAEVEGRIAAFDVHPSGPLWGRGELPSRGQARAIELEALAGCDAWCRGLEAAGLDQERRALRLPVAELAWDWLADDVLRLSFQLPRGAYATAVLRELIQIAGDAEPGIAELDDA